MPSPSPHLFFPPRRLEGFSRQAQRRVSQDWVIALESWPTIPGAPSLSLGQTVANEVLHEAADTPIHQVADITAHSKV